MAILREKSALKLINITLRIAPTANNIKATEARKLKFQVELTNF